MQFAIKVRERDLRVEVDLPVVTLIVHFPRGISLRIEEVTKLLGKQLFGPLGEIGVSTTPNQKEDGDQDGRENNDTDNYTGIKGQREERRQELRADPIMIGADETISAARGETGDGEAATGGSIGSGGGGA